MWTVWKLSFNLLSLAEAGHELLQLSLKFLSLVLRFRLGLLQTLHIIGQLLIITLQSLFVFLQIWLHLMLTDRQCERVRKILPELYQQEIIPYSITERGNEFQTHHSDSRLVETLELKSLTTVMSHLLYIRLTLLACSSCSEISSRAVPCLCLISWIWDSWFFISSSMAFFSSATSCSRLVLREQKKRHIIRQDTFDEKLSDFN